MPSTPRSSAAWLQTRKETTLYHLQRTWWGQFSHCFLLRKKSLKLQVITANMVIHAPKSSQLELRFILLTHELQLYLLIVGRCKWQSLYPGKGTRGQRRAWVCFSEPGLRNKYQHQSRSTCTQGPGFGKQHALLVAFKKSWDFRAYTWANRRRRERNHLPRQGHSQVQCWEEGRSSWG